ncbi:uncharacterized protein LOC115532526 isoform X1 [Gadus morhua]|uniref:uncharacterized protein LOC115532526 isoform X1 n=2 Tax=Gadus morhua TaxID=8049 RepID=UPI0011B6F76A|nr:uncharacterized protein LOC115532526 isoform X1 [Gadus morhua]
MTNQDQVFNNAWSNMSESHLMGFLVLFLSILRTESTIGILNSINDLKKIPFGQSVPQHSLVLLHWFANTIEFDNNDLIELTFEPSNGDYGTHHYGNYEGVLDRLPPGQRYYTLGNINPNNNGNSLPSYVTGQRNHLLGSEELNRARIIFSLLDQDTIDQVFITQHYEANQGLGTGYDPVHTYQITFNLLRVLRVFSLDRRQHSELSEIGGDFGSSIDYDELSSLRNRWGQLGCVGLLLFIVINERNTPCRPNRAREPKRPPKCNVRETKLPPKQNVRQPKPPPIPNIRVLASPPKRNVRASVTSHISVNIPERDINFEELSVRASVTPHTSVNIPENDINLRPPNQDWDIVQCCNKCWCTFKICGLIVGIVIAISITIKICLYLHQFIEHLSKADYKVLDRIE